MKGSAPQVVVIYKLLGKRDEKLMKWTLPNWFHISIWSIKHLTKFEFGMAKGDNEQSSNREDLHDTYLQTPSLTLLASSQWNDSHSYLIGKFYEHKNMPSFLEVTLQLTSKKVHFGGLCHGIKKECPQRSINALKALLPFPTMIGVRTAFLHMLPLK